MEDIVAQVEARLVSIQQSLIEVYSGNLLQVAVPAVHRGSDGTEIILEINRRRDMSENDWGYAITVKVGQPKIVNANVSECVCSGDLARSTGVIVSDLVEGARPINETGLPTGLIEFLDSIEELLLNRLQFDLSHNDGLRSMITREKCHGTWQFTSPTHVFDLVIHRDVASLTITKRDESGEVILSEMFLTQTMPMGRFLWLIDKPQYSIGYADDLQLEFGEHEIIDVVGIYKWHHTFRRVS